MKELRKNRPSVFSANTLFMLSILISQVFFTLISMIPQVRELRSNDWFNYLALSFNEIVFIFGLGWCYLTYTRRDMGKVTRLSVKPTVLQLAMVIVIYFLSLNVVGYINVYWTRFLELIGYQVMDLGIPQSETIPGLLAEILVVCIMPAICEEFLYRGIVMRAYESRGKVMAIFMSSLCFGLMHGTLERLVYTLILGAIIASIVYITDSLWAGVLFHFINNLTSSIARYIVAKGYISAGAEQTNTAITEITQVTNIVVFGVATVIAIYCLKLISKKERISLQPAELRLGIVSALPFVFATIFTLVLYTMEYMVGMVG